jgi:LysM repeat protein
MKKILNLIMLLALVLMFWPTPALAQDEAVACESDVVVQADDWLSKLADKFYGDPLAYPAIVEATNQANATDSSYAKIDNPDIIEPGWKLCLPSQEAATTLVGTELETPRFDGQKVVVVTQTGAPLAGRWRPQRRNGKQ